MAEDEVDQQQPSRAETAKKRIGRYDQYYDARSFSYSLRKTNKPKKAARAKQSKYTLVVRRLIDDRGRYQGTVIDIKSLPLRDVLREINEHVEGVDLSGTSPEMSELDLFHSYPGLCDRLDLELSHEPPNTELVEDITAAVQLVKEDQARQLNELAELTATGLVAWSSLQLLFKPNAILYTFEAGIQQERLVILREAGVVSTQEGRFVVLKCEIIHNDGVHFGSARVRFQIEQYRGLRRITDLGIYPLDFHADNASVLASAIEIGKRLVALPTHWLREYDGLAVRERENSRGELIQFRSSGRVMITATAFAQYQPGSSCNPPVRTPLAKDSLSDQQYAICSPLLLGFSLAHKSWGVFAISRVSDAVWDDDAFESLVINERQKKLVHALVRQHSEHANGFDDIIKGKGRGLIGLLAGPPGCGKTLTAEAVAEVTHKPLYQVTAGELGADQGSVENNLLKVLRLAEMWDAVLLLDEAEVFLQQRTPDHLQRNAIVSIFLRQLEYYQGILLLTTNLAHECDHAFESRIHFSIFYRDLDFDARLSIWRMFFQRSGLTIDEAQLARLAERQINGRQIKNAFSSAQTLSLSRGFDQLQVGDIDDVLEVLRDWEDAKAQNFARAAAGPSGSAVESVSLLEDVASLI